MVNNKKTNKIKTNSQFNIRKNKFGDNVHIGDKNIIQDNSVTYEENISDVRNIESFSFYVTNKFGDEKVGITGAISFIAGLLSILTSLNSFTSNTKIFSWLPSFSQNIGTTLMVVGFLFIISGSLLLNALKYKQSARCQKCGEDYAYREYKKKKIREAEAREGTKQEITKYLECKFCQDKIERSYTRTIPYEENNKEEDIEKDYW